MKKILALFAIAALFFPSTALAETPERASQPGEAIGVTLTLPEETAPFAYRLTDAYVVSRVSFRVKDTLSIEPETAAGVLVLDWYDVPASYTVTQLGADGAALLEETITDGRLGRAVALDSACKKIAVLFGEAGALGGVAAYAADEALPQGAARFQPAPEQADLLVVTAEPGMEWLQFGAVLPLYAREKGMQVTVLYLSDYGKRARAYEALAGLYEAGISDYPVFGGFSCDNYDSYKMAVEGFDKKALADYLKEEIARLNPKVIVTHSRQDVSGAHSLAAECVLYAAVRSAGVQKVYTVGEAEGTRPTVLDMYAPLNAYDGKTAADVAKSAYALHAARHIFLSEIDTSGAYTLAYSTVGEDEAKNDLFEHVDSASLLAFAPVSPSPSPTAVPAATPEPTRTPADAEREETAPQAEADWMTTLGLSYRPALYSLAGGLALSAAAFALLYRRMRAKRGKGDAVCICLIPFALGLAAAAILAGVKADEAKPAPQTAASSAVAPQDTPEAEAAAEPTPTAAPSAEPTLDPVAAFEQNYYRKEGDPAEVIVTDDEHGHWAYRSDDLGIDIERVSATNDAGKPVTYFVADIHMKDISQFRPGFSAETHSGRGSVFPWITARRKKAVLWITGDNLINDEREEKGILIRDGRLFWSANVEDTLAIYPDMSMRIVKKHAMAPFSLLEDGVENSYSFGPTLIDNGVINNQAKYHRVRRANPRCGIGYIEPGHYIAIVVDGRQKDYSVGMPIWDFADLFAEYGCTVAYNLDGGLSAGMIFMGEQLNSHNGNRIGAADDISYQRAVPDGLMFGYSGQVPSVDDPVNNDGNKY